MLGKRPTMRQQEQQQPERKRYEKCNDKPVTFP